MGKVTKNIEKHKTKPNKTRKKHLFYSVFVLFFTLHSSLHDDTLALPVVCADDEDTLETFG